MRLGISSLQVIPFETNERCRDDDTTQSPQIEWDTDSGTLAETQELLSWSADLQASQVRMVCSSFIASPQLIGNKLWLQPTHEGHPARTSSQAGLGHNGLSTQYSVATPFTQKPGARPFAQRPAGTLSTWQLDTIPLTR